jgi:GT2 family glycosyltransferase
MIIRAMQKGINIEYELRGHSLVYDAREEAVKYLLTTDADYILFLDSDMMPPADMLVKLIEHDKPIVSALAFRRVPEYEPCIYKAINDTEATVYTDYPKGLIEVAGVGMACCLIKREVFEQVPGPWYMPGKLGEDLSFCKRVRDAGIPIHVDTNLVCGHVGTVVVKEEHYVNRLYAGQKRG